MDNDNLHDEVLKLAPPGRSLYWLHTWGAFV